MTKSIRFLFSFTITACVLMLSANISMAQLSGEYYIPQGEHDAGYGSLADALNALNSEGADGTVTFWIDDDLDESGNSLYIQRDDLTEDTSILIKPAPGVTPTITLTQADEAGLASTSFDIRSTGWITIDGSNTEDGDTRDLTFYSVDSDALFWVEGPVNNVTFKNTNFHFNGDEQNRGFYFNRDQADVDDRGPIENIVFHNNSLGEEGKGIVTPFFLRGYLSGTNPDATEWVGNATVSDSDIYGTRWGVYLQSNDNVTIENNHFHMGNSTSNTAMGHRKAIWTWQQRNGVIRNNTITFSDIFYPADADGISGIYLRTSHDILIYNNFISFEGLEDSSPVGNSYQISGINTAQTATAPIGDYRIYHNTIILDSPEDNDGKHVGIGSRTQMPNGDFDIRNNLVINRKDLENSYAIDNMLAADTAGTFTSDYNNLYVTGDASVGLWTGFDDGAEAEAQATLSDWQAASGQDANSVSVAVGFAAAESPELDGESAQDENLWGTPIDGITTDIFGNERDSENPFIGAFEGSAVDVSIPVASDMPQQISLNQNYPNPFNPTTMISYELPNDQRVTLEIFNVYGQLIQTLVNDQHMSAGTHSVQFDASNLASGVYIYRLSAGEFTQSSRMTLIK